MGRKKLQRNKCIICEKIVKDLKNKCCSLKCAGLNKRTRQEIWCAWCGKLFWAEPNSMKEGRKKFCSVNCRRIGIFTPEIRAKMSAKRKGKPTGRTGEKCHFWKGGITPQSKADRMSLQARLWRESVYLRDNYICQICLKKGGRLNADHIKSFSQFPQLRFELSNGRTLCLECHKKTENYAGKSNIRVGLPTKDGILYKVK